MDGMNHQGRRGTASGWTVGCRAVVRADAEESGERKWRLQERTGHGRGRFGGQQQRAQTLGLNLGGTALRWSLIL